MENFDYVAHITFILQHGAWVPWRVCFTSIVPPFHTRTIGLDTNDLSFHYDDLYFNYNVPCFLRCDVKQQSCVSTLPDFPAKIRETYEGLPKGDWGGVVGAADSATYTYLKEHIAHVILLDTKPLSEEITFGIACRRHVLEEAWRS